MSHTPTTTGPTGNVLATNQAVQKPSLAGARIRQRKGQAKASAKFEPEVFRDALLLHLSLLPSPPTVDALVAKLVQAGSTLELLKYNEQFFELFFVGGLLQPGGAYLDEKRSPVYILQTQGEGADWKDGVKGMVEVLKRVIQRYKYLQKPLEESFLPNLLGYLPKFEADNRAKLAEATALLVLDLGIAPRCLTSLTKDHVTKDGSALNFITAFFKTYLTRQNMDHLGATLRRSGLKDLAAVFPLTIRDRTHLEEHFKKENLVPINEWYSKQASLEIKEETISSLERMVNDEEGNEQIVEYLKTQQTEQPSAESDLVEWLWQGLMRSLDWTARPDQLETAVLQHVTSRALILETFTSTAKAQIALINAIQVYCYTDTRIMKSFPALLKVLYNQDVVSDQAIIYWAEKGAKPQGKQHFLKATEGILEFLKEQESEEE